MTRGCQRWKGCSPVVIRALSRLLLEAHRGGAYLDGWGDTLNMQAWDEAFAVTGIDAASYLGPRKTEQTLPWDFIDMGIEKGFLLAERMRAHGEKPTNDCRDGDCNKCGVCTAGLTNIIRQKPEPIHLFPREVSPRRVFLCNRTFQRGGIAVSLSPGIPGDAQEGHSEGRTRCDLLPGLQPHYETQHHPTNLLWNRIKMRVCIHRTQAPR